MCTFTVGDYLLTRLQEIGIKHLFGVPGDYNLQFLDCVIDHPEISWVGCANELNAAYAADGYARCKGAGALLTTFGVGELSAINGIAGSYAEYLPVIHIVGAPATSAQLQGDCVHHSLGDGDFRHFIRMAAEVSAATAQLTADNATAEIDRVIEHALQARRPGYLSLAVDVAAIEVQPPVQPLNPHQSSSPDARRAFREAAERLLAPAERVSLLADFLALRWQQQSALAALREQSAIPCASLLMGKGVLDEQQPGYVGTYAGEASAGQVCGQIEQVDVAVCVGVRFTDTITAGFTQQFAPERLIDLQPFSASVGREHFAPLSMADALSELQPLFEHYGQQWQPAIAPSAVQPAEPAAMISQQAFWQAMQKFLQPGDLILAEQGTAAFGAAALRLPSQAQLVVQPLWGSIGYTLPAAFGAQTADPDRRVILIIGDGSAQLTIQELGSMLRDEQRLTLFLLNNEGYTVERAIHGATQRYNDIAQWNWTALPHALSLQGQAQSWRISETVQLDEVMARLSAPQWLSLVEVVMQKEDLPPLLRKVTACLNQRNGG
ncbi:MULTISPECIES: indolepyruvate decarboxylase [Pantoea]|uniref:Indolepyruvate decarboxylase n=1 Tax=Candidatus Pantoea gossypiicola TaxID=2608008 RepID=A0AB34CPI6_9GAMM|nr:MULTISPECIES: indolepyruvate decarboxylase [Pantoea]KAA5933713.1 indolepyruvate decarboxylase [Pantoea sp. VH_8]KAA5938219.1 indolepyruvate decarboxylase [Pantoea sp. VH_4]KAA5990148.1 indolepyruvate decarboxylase [Pantoea sp. M_4]KAA6129061.1 indolepyruvate decarboxylase [Pantoea gossypiicola]